MKSKRGQFYLIATMIIIAIIISFAAISNYSFKKSPSRFEEMAKELRIEGEKVLDYDKIHSTSQFEIFAKDYSEYAGNEIDIYFIVGNSPVGAFRYDGETRVNLNEYLDVGSSIVFTLDEVDYEFELEEGINFYFIIVQELEGEKYVVAG